MSNRLFQGIIHQMGDAANRTIGVIDDTGVIIACSELVKIGEARHGIHDELAYTSDAVTVEGYTYRPIGTAAKWEYIVFVEGEDDTAERLADILSISLSTIKNLYDEKYDKNSFIKNIILDNILPSDIYIKGKELRFNTEEVRVVFLIKFLSRTEVLPFNMVQQIFPDKNKDYVISISEQDIVVVKEVKAAPTSARSRNLHVRSPTLSAPNSMQRLRSASEPPSTTSRILRAPIRRLRPRSRSARYSTPKRRSSATRTSA